ASDPGTDGKSWRLTPLFRSACTFNKLGTWQISHRAGREIEADAGHAGLAPGAGPVDLCALRSRMVGGFRERVGIVHRGREAGQVHGPDGRLGLRREVLRQ